MESVKTTTRRLASHDACVIDPFTATTENSPEDIAHGVTFMLTRPRHTSVGELWILATDQA